MNISTRVKHGIVCDLRGGKLIRCGRNTRPVGIWNRGSMLVVIDKSDHKHRIDIPEGLRTYGEAEGRTI